MKTYYIVQKHSTTILVELVSVKSKGRIFFGKVITVLTGKYNNPNNTVHFTKSMILEKCNKEQYPQYFI